MPNGTALIPKPTGGLWSFSPGKAMQWYTKNVGYNPLVMGLLQSAAGGLFGRYVASPVSQWMSPAPSEESRKRRQNVLTALGIGAGLLPPALYTAGRMYGGEGLGRALFRPFGKQSDYISPFPGTQNIILADPNLSAYEKAVAIQTVQNALSQSDKRGLFTVGDLVRGAIGAGLGYAGAGLAGKLLGFAFGLSPKSQKRLRQVGTVGGILANTGVLRAGL